MRVSEDRWEKLVGTGEHMIYQSWGKDVKSSGPKRKHGSVRNYLVSYLHLSRINTDPFTLNKVFIRSRLIKIVLI